MNEKELRVCLVGPLPPPPGGMANQTKQLARLLYEEGVKVELARTNTPYYPEFIGKIKIVRALPRLFSYIFRLVRAVNKSNIVHIMANSGLSWFLFVCPAILIARMKKIPIVLNYRGGYAEEFFNKYMWAVNPLLKKVDVITVPSRFLHDVFSKFEYPTVIVPNIVDLNKFKKRIQTDQNIKKGVNILVPRSLEEIYGIDAAIEAFRLLNRNRIDITLIVAGTGPLEISLKEKVAELGLAKHIDFVGKVDNDAMPSYYQKADILLNPSLVDNMPISLLEAMASEVPIVTTNVGGIPYLVEHGITALLVPPNDAEATAMAIEKILSNNELRNKLIKNGLEEVKKYEWENIKSKLFSVYTSQGNVS